MSIKTINTLDYLTSGIYYLIIMIILSCTSNNFEYRNPYLDIDAIEVIAFNPEKDIHSEYMQNASKLVDILDYYPLQSSEGLVIGDITEMAHHDGHVYIFDRLSEAVFVFTDTGEHVGTVNNQGNGPGEYSRIHLFAVDPMTGEILILSDQMQKIFKYDRRGNFVTERPIDFLATSLVSFGDSTLAVYNAKLPNDQLFGASFPKQPRFFIIDANNHVKTEDLYYTYDEDIISYPLSGHGFYQAKDSLSLMEVLGSAIYRIDLKTGKAIPRYAFNFLGANNPPFYTMGREAVAHAMQKYREGGKSRWAGLFKVYETSDILGFNFSYGKFMNTAFYSKKSRKLINLGAIWINDMDNISMPTICTAASDGTFLGYIDAQKLRQMVSSKQKPVSERVAALAEQLKDTDNPVLVRFKLKEF